MARAVSRSPPSRGAWIEMRILYSTAACRKSPPSRGAWIEMSVITRIPLGKTSPPSRGAWIEMTPAKTLSGRSRVAPLAGGVD